jgi:hypothetical protein
MNVKQSTKIPLIAPCGMNCGICMAYLREKNKCPGCRENNINKAITVLECKIKNCNELSRNNLKYCIKCKSFPCKLINHIDKRYRTKYNMSMIENLNNIEKFGIKKFVKNENIRWVCSKCGFPIIVHKKCCSNCGEKI